MAEQVDVDGAYNNALDNLRVKRATPKQTVMSDDEKAQKQKDYYVSFSRTSQKPHDMRTDSTIFYCTQANFRTNVSQTLRIVLC